MEQMHLPGIPIDWQKFRHECEWKDWIIVVKIIWDPAKYDDVYEWTARKKDQHPRKTKLAAQTTYPSVPATINQAKEAISLFEDGYQRQYA